MKTSYAMVVAAVISNLAQFVAAIVPNARIIWAVARERGKRQLMPKCFSWSIKVRGVVVPLMGVIATAYLSAVASLLPFDISVQVYLVFRLVNLLFEFGAFVVLRFTEPNLERFFCFKFLLLFIYYCFFIFEI